MNNNNNEENEFGLELILDKVRQHWKYYALSVILCLIVGTIYTRNKTRVYQITAKVLLKDDEKGTFSSQSDMLADFGFQSSNSNVENEIEVLNSKSVVRMAVMHSGLYTQYHVNGLFSSRPIYKGASPIQLTILEDDLDNLNIALRISLTLGSDSLYQAVYE